MTSTTPTSQPIRIFLVENHTLVRAGIRTLLESLPGLAVVGEAGSGADAFTQLAQRSKADLPDIVLMDLAMQGMGGLEATEKMKKEFPAIRTVILSMHSSEEYVLQALRAGAAGYLLKDVTPNELLHALQNAMKGEIPLSPAVSRHVIADYVRRVGAVGILPDGSIGARSLPPALSNRQRQVLILITEGMSTKEIATHLGVSAKTIETHRAALMERLDIHDIAGLVRYAMRIGLVLPDE